MLPWPAKIVSVAAIPSALDVQLHIFVCWIFHRTLVEGQPYP